MQTLPGAEPGHGAAMVEVRRERGLTYSYVARDAAGEAIWRYPKQSVFTVPVSDKPPGTLVNIKA
jgi:hypothetical protein